MYDRKPNPYPPRPPYTYVFEDDTLHIIWIDRKGHILTEEHRTCPPPPTIEAHARMEDPPRA